MSTTTSPPNQSPAPSATATGTRKYWVGTLESCPIQQLTIAGVSFPRHTVIRKKVREIEQIVGYLDGGMVELSDQKAEEVKKAIDRSVQRWYGKPNEFCAYGTHGDVLDTEAKFEKLGIDLRPTGIWEKAYHAMPQDEPLAPHVQFKLVEKEADAPQFFNAKLTPYKAKQESPSAKRRVVS